MTHSMLVAGDASSAAGDQLIGSIELPQRKSGEWTIFKVFGYVVRSTATAAESVGGYIKLSPNTGEITPHPAPSKFPIFGPPSSLGSNIDAPASPLNLYDVDLSASGKANIDIYYHNSIAASTPARVIAGIMFGDERPAPTPLKWIDSVRSTIASSDDTAIGTIELSANAQRIVGVAGVLQQDGVLVAGGDLIGYFRLDSDDVKIIPAQYPFTCAWNAGLGTTISTDVGPAINLLPVDIPIPEGARIGSFVKLSVGVTNPADVEIFIAYV